MSSNTLETALKNMNDDEAYALDLLIEMVSRAKTEQPYKHLVPQLVEALKKAPGVKNGIYQALGAQLQ